MDMVVSPKINYRVIIRDEEAQRKSKTAGTPSKSISFGVQSDVSFEEFVDLIITRINEKWNNTKN